jgi:hypothetical protein
MRKTLIFPIFILLFVGFHSQVHAQTATPATHLRQELRQDVRDFKKDVRKDLKPTGPKPSGFNQKLCEAHVKVTQLRESNLAKRASNMQTRLDKIAALVENYYTTKLLPQGKTVSNYDSLVSDVNAKKAALSPLVSKVQSDSEALTCDNGAATSQFQTFRTDATALITAFKAYRQSVINLIQAVRSASGETAVSPTVTPEITQ